MASAGLDLSLDDLIKQRKQASRGARGGGRGRGEGGSRGSGPVRRSNRGAFRSTPYAFKPTPMDIDGQWDHEMFASGAGPPVGPIETGSKLYISNLDFGVSNEDIRTLFSEIGELKRSSVNYDRSGRSKGTAEVVYVRKADAIAAMQKYSNVQLDGKLMKIELIGTNLPIAGIPPAFNPALAAGFARRGGFAMPYRGRGRGTFVGGRGAVRGRGRGRGRGRARETPKSQEELDAELDAYQAQKDKSTEMQV